jgi:hypothetical protein
LTSSVGQFPIGLPQSVLEVGLPAIRGIRHPQDRELRNVLRLRFK